MKTAHSQIVVGIYNRRNLFQLLSKVTGLGVRLGPGKEILKDMVDWPENKFPRRSEIFPFPTNYPLKCSRIANLFELCAFIIRKPGFVCQSGSIEAYDESLQDFYKETQIDLVVPVFGIYDSHTTLYLRSQKKPPEAFKLGAHD